MRTADQSTVDSANQERQLPSVVAPRLAGGYSLWFALGYAPLLALFFINLWGRPHYRFFPLALMAAAFLAWDRLKEVPRPLVAGTRRVTGLLLGASFILLVVASGYWSPWLVTSAAWTGLVGVIWWQGGRRLLTAMLPALVLLLTIVPLPLSGDARLIQQIRVLAVKWSSTMLDMLGVTHALSGNVIELPRQQLLVDEACSGINSVLITLACALFYGMWRRRPWIHILVGLANALAFVLLGNLARITLGAWLKYRYGINILTGAAHEAIGLVLFASYLVMILSMDQLLWYLFSPARPRSKQPTTGVAVGGPPPQAFVAGLAPAWARVAGCAFALVGVVDLALIWVHHQHPGAQLARSKPALMAGARFAMPDQIGAWRRLTTEVPPLQKVETLGVYSQVWHYRKGDTLASLALDYPFQGYHDVTLCYTLRGWDLLERRALDRRGTNACPALAEVRMRNNVGLHAALWYSVVDERGRWLPGPGFKPSFKDSLLRRIRLGELNSTVTYQVQVLSTGFNPLLPPEREQVRQLFEEARVLLWQQLSRQMRRDT
ncbi:MAG TPA: exosortase U [Verrucomicrobiota bacterium]|nr:exosortase U [Verrucomicrobiota bacterium]